MNKNLNEYITAEFLLEQLLYQIVMYLPLEELGVEDGDTIADIVAWSEVKEVSDTAKEYLSCITVILEQRGNLGDNRIRNLSWLDYDGDGKKDHPPTGMVAAVFVNEGSGSLYVAFRGTPKGAWLDNAKMLIGDKKYNQDFTDPGGTVWRYCSPMQAEAMEYISELIGNRGEVWNLGRSHYVIGHSKGGNQAQLAMVIFPDSFDVAISMNGPGMSPESIQEMKHNLGEEQYQRILGRLIGINAYNDYVHGLGIPLIPYQQNVWFIEPDCSPIILCSHYVTALLQEGSGAVAPFNEDGPGPAAVFMRRLSAEAMVMPVADRSDIFMTLMAVMQVVQGKSMPVNALQEDWLRLIAGLEEGGIKMVSLLASVLLGDNRNLLELFSN